MRNCRMSAGGAAYGLSDSVARRDMSMAAPGLALIEAVPNGAASHHTKLVARFDADRVRQGSHFMKRKLARHAMKRDDRFKLAGISAAC